MLPPHNTNSSFVLGNVKGFSFSLHLERHFQQTKLKVEKKSFLMHMQSKAKESKILGIKVTNSDRGSWKKDSKETEAFLEHDHRHVLDCFLLTL